jgi:hypothetical protein
MLGAADNSSSREALGKFMVTPSPQILRDVQKRGSKTDSTKNNSNLGFGPVNSTLITMKLDAENMRTHYDAILDQPLKKSKKKEVLLMEEWFRTTAENGQTLDQFLETPEGKVLGSFTEWLKNKL